jgi:uncharacterized protein
MATLENFAIARAIAVAIGTGALIMAIEIGPGFATYHIKPFLLDGLAMGGSVFNWRIYFRDSNFTVTEAI